MYADNVKDSFVLVNKISRIEMKDSKKNELYERVTAAGKFFGGIPTFAEMVGVQYRTFLGYLNRKRQHNLWPLLPARAGPPLRLLACFCSGFFYHITMIDIILP